MVFQAYKKYWINYANFEGTSSRSDFWWVVLCHFLIGLPFAIVGIFLFYLKTFDFIISNPTALDYLTDQEAVAFGFEVITALAPLLIIALIWWLATLIPTLALEVRRYRDAGFSWALIFLNLGSLVLFIPVIGWLIALGCLIARLVFLVQPSKQVPENSLAPALSQEEKSVSNTDFIESSPLEESGTEEGVITEENEDF